MIRSISLWTMPLLLAIATDLCAQRPPYDVFPPAEPPYYRVRYEASTRKGELVYPINYTVWIPKGVQSLRGVIVHQHGCGEGSCKSGLTGAYDLHWQALARKHDCALLAPSYEQPEKADCQLWCDPRNGSDAAFQKCLVDLGVKSGHAELPKIPWALWGHSGGGHWAGGMVMLHPERVAAAWLRSGVPLLKADPERPTIKPHTLPYAALTVPVMCNLGTKEGVTVKDGPFAGVWPANEAFFRQVRGKGGLIGVAVDPLSSHECGNQRYLAIPWLDACLSARLPKVSGDPLQAMPKDKAWLASITGAVAVPAARFGINPLKGAWLPNEAVGNAWMQYVKDTAVNDATPPPAPTKLRLKGSDLAWEAEADLESGLASFIIERDGKFLAKLPEQGKNPFGRPIFQNLQYSDTPTQPLVQMRYTDTKAEPGKKHTYRVVAVNTAGLKSMPSVDSVIAAQEKPKFEIVDTHTHFYDPTRPQGVPWPGKSEKLLYRPVLPDEYKKFARPFGVVGAIVVEASPWVEDNQWLLDLAAKEPFLIGIVGHLDPKSDDFGKNLRRFARSPLYRGIRISHSDLIAGLKGNLVERCQLLADLNLVLDVNGGPDMPAEVARLAEKLPKLRIVINHAANLRIDGREPPAKWREGMQAAAKHPNVFCKVSALVEQTGQKPAPRDVAFYRPVLDALWTIFGEDRLIFGSNWPVSNGGAPYENVVGIVTDYFTAKGDQAAAKFFLGNSQTAYAWRK